MHFGVGVDAVLFCLFRERLGESSSLTHRIAVPFVVFRRLSSSTDVVHHRSGDPATANHTSTGMITKEDIVSQARKKWGVRFASWGVERLRHRPPTTRENHAKVDT